MGTVLSCLAQNSITFRVDMQQPIHHGIFRPYSDDRIVVRGSFDNWQTDSIILTDTVGKGVYKGQAILSDTLNDIEYKYVIVRDKNAHIWEWYPDDNNPPYGNRRLELNGKPQQLPAGNFEVNPYDYRYVGETIRFSKEHLSDDFIQLRRVLEQDHCCLYNYTSKSTFDSLFEKQYQLIKKSMSPEEFFRILAPISAHIGCGHSSLWMPGDFWKMGPDKLFPIQINSSSFIWSLRFNLHNISSPGSSFFLQVMHRPRYSMYSILFPSSS